MAAAMLKNGYPIPFLDQLAASFTLIGQDVIELSLIDLLGRKKRTCYPNPLQEIVRFI